MESDHYITENGNLLILSGQSGERHAGVGFIISKGLRHAVHSFDCFNARLAAVKIFIPGGKMAFLSVYTPQSQHPADVRMEFVTQLEAFYSSISVNGQKIILGDMNSRLRCKFANEDSIVGDYFFRGIHRVTMRPSAVLSVSMGFC